MGWLYTRRDKDTTPVAFLTAQFDHERYEVLAHATYMREVYVAVKDRRDETVTAMVFLIHHCPRDAHYNFGYKDMDESMGPVVTSCPARILDLLTEPPNNWAREWREKCRATIAAREQAKTVVSGSRIRIEGRLSFSNGHVIEPGTVVTVSRRGRSVLVSGYHRLPPLHEFTYSLVEEVRCA